MPDTPTDEVGVDTMRHTVAPNPEAVREAALTETERRLDLISKHRRFIFISLSAPGEIQAGSVTVAIDQIVTIGEFKNRDGLMVTGIDLAGQATHGEWTIHSDEREESLLARIAWREEHRRDENGDPIDDEPDMVMHERPGAP